MKTYKCLNCSKPIKEDDGRYCPTCDKKAVELLHQAVANPTHPDEFYDTLERQINRQRDLLLDLRVKLMRAPNVSRRVKLRWIYSTINQCTSGLKKLNRSVFEGMEN